ncbi:MAG: hypothetical protein LBJ59_11955 [Zoogloeaceae bacterium]|jgi:hypothetical protein|nr:hypothetical protein [Zoogloeaceae bacterium]
MNENTMVMTIRARLAASRGGFQTRSYTTRREGKNRMKHITKTAAIFLSVATAGRDAVRKTAFASRNRARS